MQFFFLVVKSENKCGLKILHKKAKTMFVLVCMNKLPLPPPKCMWHGSIACSMPLRISDSALREPTAICFSLLGIVDLL